jgi:hypothetical protein
VMSLIATPTPMALAPPGRAEQISITDCGMVTPYPARDAGSCEGTNPPPPGVPAASQWGAGAGRAYEMVHLGTGLRASLQRCIVVVIVSSRGGTLERTGLLADCGDVVTPAVVQVDARQAAA